MFSLIVGYEPRQDSATSPSTLIGVGHQWTIPTSKDHFKNRFSQWESLDATNVGTHSALVACTSSCGWTMKQHMYMTRCSKYSPRIDWCCANLCKICTINLPSQKLNFKHHKCWPQANDKGGSHTDGHIITSECPPARCCWSTHERLQIGGGPDLDKKEKGVAHGPRFSGGWVPHVLGRLS